LADEAGAAQVSPFSGATTMTMPSPRALQKLEALLAVAEEHGCPWIEYREGISGPAEVLRRLDYEQLRAEGWFPLTVTAERARIITSAPSPQLAATIASQLEVTAVEFVVTLPGDLARIIDHNQDLNPRFPPAAGRTPLAKVRTYLAVRRSLLAHYRTLMAKSRTGLAFVRTGFAFISIAILFFRLLGGGFWLLLEVPLLLLGLYLAITSLWSYLPSRQVSVALPPGGMTEASGGTTMLTVARVEGMPIFSRTEPVLGAAQLRAGWSALSPVMRRRFLASDRTDLAEERTELANLRTRMAKVRTGLAFVRTGNALIGFGFGMMRQFPSGAWHAFDLGLACIGGVMVAEGLFWYLRGRPAGVSGLDSVRRGQARETLWEFFVPHRHPEPGTLQRLAPLPVSRGQAPGIWATTGLALERTMLAERRNVMARLRTTMARARTGFSFIRTGLSIFLVGVVFAVYLPYAGLGWLLVEAGMMVVGLFLIADGLVWSLPAERSKREFPYCFADMEMVIPDYGTPCRAWKKAVFSRER
jgi:uncharacterized membrane protein YidH (DUF202 family)